METQATAPFTVCAIAGSLRIGSYNAALLRAAQQLAPDGMKIEIYDGLGSIPLFNEDIESKGDPPEVVRFKTAIKNADALLIATPEYNYSIPGVLKNAIDWASRPPGQSVLRAKPAALMGATLGSQGTARSQLALRQAFVFTETLVLLKPEVLVSGAQNKFDSSGRLIDEATRHWVRQLLEALGSWSSRFRDKGK